MSSAIDVYAVPDERLKRAIGSRDRALADAVFAAHRDFFSDVDEIDDESELKAVDALRELIDGQPSGNGGGYLYGYALKAICAHLGEQLPNVWGIAGASDWIEEVDRNLAAKSLPLKLSDLVYGGSPVPIPEPDDYPFIGRWAAGDVARAVPAFRAANLSGIDSRIAETINQMRSWLERAVKSSDTSLVGFLF
jgi:hypothetical protein